MAVAATCRKADHHHHWAQKVCGKSKEQKAKKEKTREKGRSVPSGEFSITQPVVPSCTHFSVCAGIAMQCSAHTVRTVSLSLSSVEHCGGNNSSLGDSNIFITGRMNRLEAEYCNSTTFTTTTTSSGRTNSSQETVWQALDAQIKGSAHTHMHTHSLLWK